MTGPGGREAPTVSTLRAGEALEGVFACTRKDRQVARSGSPYLTVELRDGTGSVVGRVFRDADLQAGRFDKGDLVRVAGQVGRFKDQLQVEVHRIERTELPPDQVARFLPTSKLDLDELEGFLEHLVREVYDPGLRGLCERVLSDPKIRPELRRAPCGVPGEPRAGRHHAYLGGLLEHTVAVATLALEACQVHARLDRDLLLSAAVLHDIGRTMEFSYGAEVERTEEGKMLGHVQLSLRVIASHCPSGLEKARRLALEHCVAIHHGADGAELRFGSPEAVALYRINALDAHVKASLERPLR